MISFSCNTDDPVSRYGFNHFVNTTGLSAFSPETMDSGVCVGYEPDESGKFSVTITQNAALEKDAGIISFNNGECHLFQVPVDTHNDGNNCIAVFRSEKQEYPCVSGSESGITIGFDIFRLTGSLLTGYLDKTDNNDNPVHSRSEVSAPPVDFYEDLLFRAILSGCREKRIPLVRKSYWPSGKEFAVCLTHDVDELKKTYQWFTRPMRFLKNGDFYGLKNQMKSLSRKFKGYEPYWTFEEIIQNEKKYGVHSTYFFLKESGEKSLFDPKSWHLYGRCHSLKKPHIIDLIRTLSVDGHEIGVHGSTFSYNNPALLTDEKIEIEELLEKAVNGIRQHRLNLTIPETWEYQSEAGFLYDTSLGYLAADGTGFRWGTCFPFHPLGSTGTLSLLEVPLSLMDITLQNVNDGWNTCSNVIEMVRNVGGVLTLLWHPAVFNELEYPEIGDWYWKIIQECRENDAWITTGEEISAWWNEREQKAFGCHFSEEIVTVSSAGDGGCTYDLFVPENRSATLLSDNATLVEGKNGHYILRSGGEVALNKIVVQVI